MTKPSNTVLEVEAARQLLSLVGDSHALSHALVMVLASTPVRRYALCQVAYELHEKLTEAAHLFHALEKSKPDK